MRAQTTGRFAAIVCLAAVVCWPRAEARGQPAPDPGAGPRTTSVGAGPRTTSVGPGLQPGAHPPGDSIRISADALPAAIAQAVPGAVIEVHGGRLRGPLVVEKPLVLHGRDNPIIDGGGRGTVVTLAARGIVFSGFTVARCGDSLLDDDSAILVTADDVTVERTRIEGGLHGIYVLRANRFRLIANRIRGKSWINDENRGNGIHLHVASDGVIEGNDIAEVRDGVYFNYADRNVISHNRAARLRYGLHYMWSNDNRFTANVFTDSVGGAALMYSRGIVFEKNTFARHRGFRAHGVLFKDVERCRAVSNRFLDNTEGITLDGAIDNEFTGNLIAGNDAAVVEFANSEANLFAGNAFVGNGTELREIGQESSSRWDDGRRGNFWSGYDGYDLDADGVGDRPYALQNLFEYLEGQRPVLRILAYGPAASAVRKAEEAFPVLRQRRTADRRPLMKIPRDVPTRAADRDPDDESQDAPRPPRHRRVLAGVSALVFAGGLTMMLAGRRRTR